jgi:type VI protein secretion system component Hcp
MAEYFLTVQGMDGGSKSNKHKGAFSVSDFNFDITKIVSNTGSGGGAGKPVLAPLSVDIERGSYLNGLLKAAASGLHIKSVTLQGDNAQGGTFYDMRLEGVTVVKVSDTNGIDKLQFSFDNISIAERSVNAATGGLQAADVFSYNVKTGLVGATQLAAATAGTVGSGGNPVDYFLHINGLKGTSTAKNFKDDFEVDSFNFNVFNTPASSGSGSGGGKPTFSPLTVVLENGSPLNGLIKLAAQDRHLPVIDLKGADADQHTVYDLKLSDVTVTKVNNGRYFEKVQFAYSKVQLTTWEVKDNGTLAAPEVFAFDLKANTALKTVSAKQAVVEHIPSPEHDPGTILAHLDFGFAHDNLLA